MGRLIRLLENRTAMLLAVFTVLLAAAAFGVSRLTVSLSDENAAGQVSDRMMAAAGYLAENTGLSDEQIAEAFTSADMSGLARGEEILSEYGFRAGSGRGSEYLYTRSVWSSLCAAGGVLLCGALGLWAVSRVLSGVRTVTRSASDRKKCTSAFKDRDTELLAENVDMLIDDNESVKEKLSGEKQYLAEYLQDFSHQIKTPSAGLTLNNEIYLSHPMPPEEQAEYLERDRVCIERINRLCGESLKLARLEAGAVGYRREQADLRQLAEDACAPLYELAASNGSELTVDIPEGMTLECDVLWLGEAVSNLVKNACEHTENGSITVTAEADPVAVNLYITDTGEGIPEEDIPMLFRRFWSKRSERNPSSVGIGMSISKRIIEDMGGKIFIETAPGRGTRIRAEFLRTV